MRKSKGYFIALPSGFQVLVPSKFVPPEDQFTMNPSGLYVTHSVDRAELHYAGEQAGESHASFEIPSDPAYLRKLGKELAKLAKQIEAERGDR